MSSKESVRVKSKLLAENEELRLRLAESEEALYAIRNGEVDAIMVSGTEGAKVFTLSSAETPYRIILEELSEGAAIIKADGTILYCNQRFADLFFTSCQSLVSSDISELIAGEDRAKFIKLLQAGLKGRTKGFFSPSLSKSESQLYFNFSFRHLPSEVMGDICIIVTDVTEMRQFQNHLEELIRERTLVNEELVRSNKELERFAYVASHDLQEPLRMVTSYTQLLEKRYKDQLDEKAQEYINFAIEGSKRMYDLLNGLLDYSRIHIKGKVFTQVNLNKVLENVTKSLSLKIRETNTDLKADKLPEITADEFQMTQLFQNLISNSIKFSTRSPRICISSIPDHDHHIISVKDEGLGIEPQYFEKIFDIFQRLHTRDEYEGIGIGLAICKRIVECHDGIIWVESEYGKGSTFTFKLPKNNIQD